jgi:hypothetical protein
MWTTVFQGNDLPPFGSVQHDGFTGDPALRQNVLDFMRPRSHIPGVFQEHVNSFFPNLKSM